MSDQAHPGADDGGTPQPVQPTVQVGGDLSSDKKGGSKLRLVLIVVGVLVLATGGTFGYMKWKDHSHKTAQQTAASTKLNAETKTVGDASVKAEDLQNQGQTSQAVQSVQTQIAATTDPNSKAQLYILEATLYLNANDYANSLKAGQQAEKLSPSPGSAQIMAQSEAGLGDKTQAIADYQTAENRYKQAGDYGSYLDMQAAIKGLQS